MFRTIICCYLIIISNNNLHAQCANDIVPPIANCQTQAVNLFLDNSGATWLYATQLDAGSTDNCGIKEYLVNGQDSVALFCNQQATYFILEVVDSANNVSTCTTLVEVMDTTRPSPSCRQNMTAYLDASGMAIVLAEDIDFYSVDNCSITSKLINGQSSILFTCDSINTSPHLATLTLIDLHGNQNSCQTLIYIQDTILPTMQCYYSKNIWLDSMGVGSIAAIEFDSGSYDNCGAMNILLNGGTSWACNCSNLNSTNLMLSGYDPSGNVNYCTVFIQAKDTLAPLVYCQNIDAYLNTSGNVSVSADDIDNGSTDNCGIYSKTFQNGDYIKNFTCTDIGIHYVTLIVTDNSGNRDSCFATIRVIDTIPPVVVCYSQNINLTGGSYWLLTPNDVGVAYDNCMIDSQFLTPNVFTCTDIGAKPFTLTIKDQSGNTTTYVDTVYVFAAAPSITNPSTNLFSLCVGDTLYLAASVPSTGLVYNATWQGPLGLISAAPTNAILPNITLAHEGFYYFTTVPSNGFGCPVSDSFYLEVDTCLAAAFVVDRVASSSNITIFPNPVQQSMTIKTTKQELISIQLMTITGQSIQYYNPNRKTTFEIDLSSQVQGLYLLEIETAEGVFYRKVVLE